MFLFVGVFEDGKLKLTHYSVFKKEVYKDIVIVVIQSVFDFDYFEKKRVGLLNFVKISQGVDELVF